MNTIILSSLCALALNVSARPAMPDTVDRYVVDDVKIEKFDGSQLVGKTVRTYDITIAEDESGKTVYRVHDIHTAKNIRYYYADVPENTGVPHVDRINELMAKVKELENNLPVMGTLSGALCIVDGKETELDTASLKTEDIISVIIRKPGSKEALAYGDKGKNGVVFIATRNGVKNRSAMETSPLIIIDGKKSSGKDLAALQAEDIVSMKVLKNGEEVKKYTDEDVSGVILIYTRKKR